MELEDRVNKLNGTILDAFTSSCPVSKPKGKAQPPWWTRELSVLRKEVRRPFNRAKRTGDWEEYSVGLKKYNKEIRKAKRSSFRTFCENIASTPAAAMLHKALARDNTGTRLAIRLPNGAFSGTEQEKALALLSAHFPDAIPTTGDTLFRAFRPSSPDWKLAKSLINRQTVRWALDSFERYKAPGVDAKAGRGALASTSCGHYEGQSSTASHSQGVPEGQGYLLAKSFRPISLTSFMLKAMEKIIDHEIRFNTLKQTPLHSNQHAYRVGRSTDTALYALTEEIQGAFECDEVVLCAFLDIEGPSITPPI
ncbi:uncharacterized protein LOC118749201 [Rhagoletis pomonella]|uniref:uncharacterized protein LOC118749201 n=1 Tax=Rhagoletis pomonella TaxID=28610 RepID=UPI00177E61F3|nr:uncharacterized protein LOC118749201 [Rhagoletis pomonella]